MNAQPIGLMFGQHPFHIEFAAGTSFAVSDGTDMRVDMHALEAPQLIELKNMAHNQYVRAMLFDDPELDVHRATLNALCRALERRGNPVAGRTALDRRRIRSAPARPAAAGSKTARAA